MRRERTRKARRERATARVARTKKRQTIELGLVRFHLAKPRQGRQGRRQGRRRDKKKKKKKKNRKQDRRNNILLNLHTFPTKKKQKTRQTTSMFFSIFGLLFVFLIFLWLCISCSGLGCRARGASLARSAGTVSLSTLLAVLASLFLAVAATKALRRLSVSSALLGAHAHNVGVHSAGDAVLQLHVQLGKLVVLQNTTKERKKKQRVFQNELRSM